MPSARWPRTACITPWRSSLPRSARIRPAGSIWKTSNGRAAGGWPRCAADRQASAVLQSSGLYRGDGRASGRGARRDSAERRDRARLIYTAHSIPAAMAERSPYEHQLREACRLVTESVKQKGEGGKAKGRGLATCLSEPERAARAALAGAGHPRPHPPIARRRRAWPTSWSCRSASWRKTRR